MKEPPTRSEKDSQEGAGLRSDRLLTIGQVVDYLQPDFADLSITKVRYLEDRGLLSPVRTPGRYRKYTAADVRRLRTILTLQRDDYLPLDVIRQRVDRGTAAVIGQSLASAVAPVRPSSLLKREEPVYTWGEVCETAGVDEAFLRMLLEYRLIDRPSQSGVVFTESDLETARICHLLARFGVEPRNLRLLGSSVEREAALLEQVATPSLRSTHPDKREYGEKMLEDLGGLLSHLIHLVLYKELRKLL
jgi:DNA-binding transcriptional MerR regulator